MGNPKNWERAHGIVCWSGPYLLAGFTFLVACVAIVLFAIFAIGPTG